MSAPQKAGKMRDAKEFVLTIYPDVQYRKYGDEVYTSRHGWYLGQGYIARVKPKSSENVSIAYDILVNLVYNETAGWLRAKQIIEQRMLEKLLE